MTFDPSSEHLQTAKLAVERLMGFYPTINASDPKIYLSGMVQIFSRYPEHLIAEAVDPVNGLPSVCDYLPTIAKVKGFLEPRFQEWSRQQEMIRRFKVKKLPEPEHKPDPKVVDGFKKLSAYLKAGHHQ